MLQVVQDLMSKASDVFLEHFARLGVFSKVHALIGPTPEEEERAKVKEEKVVVTLAETVNNQFVCVSV